MYLISGILINTWETWSEESSVDDLTVVLYGYTEPEMLENECQLVDHYTGELRMFAQLLHADVYLLTEDTRPQAE